jgi:hypothetical protein
LFSNVYPNFKKGRILKASMLQNINDYTTQMIDKLYSNYSDGIIVGAEVTVEENYLLIARAIIKHAGIIYMIKKDLKIKYYKLGEETVLKMKFFDVEFSEDFTNYRSEIFLDNNTKISRDEIELCRFKLREGEVLKNNCKKFSDIFNEYNNLSFINTTYAGLKEPTLNINILKLFSEELLEKKDLTAYDVAFAMECLNEQRIPRKLIIIYLEKKLGISDKQYSNMEICEYLRKILRRG